MPVDLVRHMEQKEAHLLCALSNCPAPRVGCFILLSPRHGFRGHLPLCEVHYRSLSGSRRVAP